jgi:hypothetical protein
MGKINWKVSMICFWAAYFVITAIGMGHTIFNIAVLKMGSMADVSQAEMAVSADSAYSMGEAYAATVPFHPLYNIVFWPLFAFLYFKLAKTEKNQWKTALSLGLSWTLITVVFDLFGWVIIKHPWALTFKGFYVDYQPWITLIYAAIFVSTYIGMFFHNKSKV